MRTIGRRLTYANVVSTLALFLVLTGGVAFAAHRYLTKKSVGTPQLKSNAVTTAKIKANSITTRKIKRIAISSEKLKENAVTTEKLADGAVDSEKIDMESVPFTRVAARMKNLGTLTLETEPQVFPLNTSSYTQAATELDSFAGAVKVTIPAKCTAPRQVNAYVVVDPKDPKLPSEDEIVAQADFQDSTVGALSPTIELQPNPNGPLRFEPGTATKRTVDLVVSATCTTGGGVTASSGQVDVVATR